MTLNHALDGIVTKCPHDKEETHPLSRARTKQTLRILVPAGRPFLPKKPTDPNKPKAKTKAKAKADPKASAKAKADKASATPSAVKTPANKRRKM